MIIVCTEVLFACLLDLIRYNLIGTTRDGTDGVIFSFVKEPGAVFIKLAEIKFCLKSETAFGLKLVAIHKIVETKFNLRFGLKLKTGT